jgi:aminoglycoside phosphotransferase (APT) family kinase protein
LTDPATRLAARLPALLGGPVTVEELHRLSGGASRETWALTAVGPGGRRELILRGGSGTGAVDLAVEAEAMTAAARAGVPVPVVVDAGTADGELGMPYLLMERVDGETIPRRILRDPGLESVRAGLARHLGVLLARLHAVPLELVPSVRPIGDPLDHLRTAYDAGRPPPPGLALGLRWLADNRPSPADDALVHGDFRMGNLIIGPSGLRAVLDWELVHIGDPVEDLGWLCAKAWRFGSSRPAGGVGSREQLLDGYEFVAGWRPSAAQLHWWEVYATVRWGLMTGAMTARHLSGASPSVELAAIGRRACEQEFDVLLALGLAAPSADVPLPDPVPDPLLYGRPTAVELVDAVAGFLASDVQPQTADRTSFLARVAGNVLAAVRRELLLGPSARARHRRRLDALACVDDDALSTAITSGSLDDRWDDVVDAVREAVRDELLVANPRHLSAPA